ncbi:MAG: carboxymuconolactone decarboxylase family protein [Dehalococcoidia bacterium]|jgi:4-carboxymuconolactone decarboxylase|nr:carboxymuconolactone decarboxylase family protein [Dehalococcoidia bacterium]|tara:strand:+ start:25064 stop:25621 length:558 start_codon:yes stop_codon:yes gene_type:complete
MPRLSPIDLDNLSAQQQVVVDKMLSGPRGSMRGPFESLLRRPELCDRVQHLGAYCRFDTSLSPDVAELAIILTGKHWTAQFEFWAHARLARDAGLPDEIIESVRVGDEPIFPKTDKGQQYNAVYTFVKEYFATNRISEQTYTTTKEQIGENGIIDLVGIMGYYCLVSLTLNTFEVTVPDGESNPF